MGVELRDLGEASQNVLGEGEDMLQICHVSWIIEFEFKQCSYQQYHILAKSCRFSTEKPKYVNLDSSRENLASYLHFSVIMHES